MSRTYPFSQADRLTLDPTYAELRENEPVCRVTPPYGGDGWLITRYEDVKVVMADPRFSRAATVGRDVLRVMPNPTRVGTILGMDPPEHTRLRKLVAKAFTARRVEELRPRTQQITDELIDKLSAYMAGLVEQRRQTPTDDMLGVLVAARDEEDRLTEQELVIFGATLLVAGHETTANEIGNIVVTLFDHPDQLAALRADPGLLPGAIEELIRFIPLGTSVSFSRIATEDVEIAGMTIPTGDAVLVNMSSANRDETVFDHADQLDLRRQVNQHLAFGHGAHHCLGAQLARMELQVAVGTLLRRFPNLALAESVKFRQGHLVRGPETVKVTW